MDFLVLFLFPPYLLVIPHFLLYFYGPRLGFSQAYQEEADLRDQYSEETGATGAPPLHRKQYQDSERALPPAGCYRRFPHQRVK